MDTSPLTAIDKLAAAAAILVAAPSTVWAFYVMTAGLLGL